VSINTAKMRFGSGTTPLNHDFIPAPHGTAGYRGERGGGVGADDPDSVSRGRRGL